MNFPELDTRSDLSRCSRFAKVCSPCNVAAASVKDDLSHAELVIAHHSHAEQPECPHRPCDGRTRHVEPDTSFSHHSPPEHQTTVELQAYGRANGSGTAYQHVDERHLSDGRSNHIHLRLLRQSSATPAHSELQARSTQRVGWLCLHEQLPVSTRWTVRGAWGMHQGGYLMLGHAIRKGS